jgi:hypothetical protein
MSETTGTGRRTTETRVATDSPARPPVVHESYSFVCLRCGHGWEQSYDIEHHFDAKGKEFVVYTTGGRRVPSPLSQPTCGHCDGHVVRIMRPGRVSTVLDSMHRERVPGQPSRRASGAARRSGPTQPGDAGAGAPGAGATQARVGRAGTAGRLGHRLWHASHLLRLLHLQRRPR